MKIIDAQMALEMLVDIAKEHPDFRYQEHYNACRYYNTFDPIRPTNMRRCIVGEVLSRLGISNDALNGYGSRSISTIYLTVNRLLNHQGMELRHDAINVLREAQRAQDEGATWWQAVKLAEAEVG